ncbi:MAG: 50S ribosomal protein L6, large subunit ribosomal protein L6 [archaeon GW2011_AR3]|nr:50S ribosomal protein L6, large subunit ribosomal protein L6 [uncultured archaeon]KHO46815.1 MAG: 50S ribosomal protein L6, large subunit ribosomal protein L6 [archaeon GW2011_AR3]MBS3109352.1 50S ribosomal protein L6 [Candidatus Woesearchaeota archaeon]
MDAKNTATKKPKDETRMKGDTLLEAVEIPQGVNVAMDKRTLKVKGEKGEVARIMYDPKVRIEVKGEEVNFIAKPWSQKEKKKVGSMMAHFRNMIKGVQDGVTYKLKICSGHFPMNVAVSGKQLIVKNLLGEKIPRVLSFSENVKVKIEGEIIIIEGIDKELVAQTAASIETLTRRVGFDRRRFQDGIYIIDKNGKKAA